MRKTLKHSLINFFNANGRASRKEYLTWFIFMLFFSYFPSTILMLWESLEDSLLSGIDPDKGFAQLIVIFLITWSIIGIVGLVIGNIFILIRRLHDINLSGYYILMLWVPILQIFAFIWFIFTPTNNDNNNY
jgi:uncharacterized membrane protein YhaH (DUF805 family)